jgi:hypothetical protein
MRGERAIREHHGTTAEAYLPTPASAIHALAVDLYQPGVATNGLRGSR